MLTLVMYFGLSISKLRNIVLVGIVLVLLSFMMVPDSSRVERLSDIQQEMLTQNAEIVTVLATIDKGENLMSKRLEDKKEAVRMIQEAKKISIMKRREEKETRRNDLCTFFDPKYNESRPIRCDADDFISFVRSRCKTRLGNQMSSYAAVLYFQKKYGMVPVMDPFQMNIMKSVFNADHFSVKELNLLTCCERFQKKWKKVSALKSDKRTGVSLGLAPKFEKNSEKYSRNHLVGLGPHTMPVFLYKEVLPQLKKEFIFKDRILHLANNFMKAIKDKLKIKNIIYVGIHARRGDRIQKWRHRAFGSTVGLFEGKFFNEAMDMFRSRYNKPNQKVIFIPTSDDYFWIKKHLVNKNDTYFSREMVKETRKALPNNAEIGKMWHNWNLAVKGTYKCLKLKKDNDPLLQVQFPMELT